ncbi:MAG: hypothetical protein RIR00_1011 [Pseudomonadota bacterium]
MARKPRETTNTAIVPAVDEAAVIDATQAATVYGANLSKVLEQYGDGLPYDRARYIDKARYHMSRSAEEALEVGKCLVVMREAEPHGDWQICLESIGMERTLAHRMMQAAARFSNVASTQHLLESVKSRTKLFELMVLDDDDIKELSDGGSVAGLTLDEVDRMPVSQLRAALREAKQSAVDKERLLDEKNRKLDELSSDMFRTNLVTTPFDQKLKDFKTECSAHFDILDESCARMLQFNDAVMQDDFGCPDDEARQQQAIRTVATLFGDRLYRTAQALAEVVDRYNATLAGWAAELDNRDLHRSLADSAPAEAVSA